MNLYLITFQSSLNRIESVYDCHKDLFVEIDKTCPCLCSQHKEQNEAKAKGTKMPRQVTDYPYSNQNSAQGITKYIPLALLKKLMEKGGEL